MSETKKVTMPWVPPLLKGRLEHYKLKAPHFSALNDRVFIMPLEDADQLDTTAGGIAIAQETRDKMGAQRGLLVDAGAAARQQLYAMGVGIGHIVFTMRFSRWQRMYQSPDDRRFYQVLICTANEVMGSEDVYKAQEAGDLFYEMDIETGEVNVADRENDRPRNDPPPRDYGV